MLNTILQAATLAVAAVVLIRQGKQMATDQQISDTLDTEAGYLKTIAAGVQTQADQLTELKNEIAADAGSQLSEANQAKLDGIVADSKALADKFATTPAVAEPDPSGPVGTDSPTAIPTV